MPEEIIEIHNIKPITPPIFVDETRIWYFPIPFRNENIKSAQKSIENWYMDRKRGAKDSKPLFS